MFGTCGISEEKHNRGIERADHHFAMVLFCCVCRGPRQNDCIALREGLGTSDFSFIWGEGSKQATLSAGPRMKALRTQ